MSETQNDSACSSQISVFSSGSVKRKSEEFSSTPSKSFSSQGSQKPVTNLSGYIHNISDLKTSSNQNKYFDAFLQTDNGLVKLSVFNVKEKSKFEKAQLEKTAIELKHVQELENLSYRYVHNSSISDSEKLPFCYDNTLKTFIPLNKITSLSPFTKINIAVSVSKLLETTPREKGGNMYAIKKYSIRDATACSVLNSWVINLDIGK